MKWASCEPVEVKLEEEMKNRMKREMGEIRVRLRLANVDEDDDDPKAVSLFLMESKAVE